MTTVAAIPLPVDSIFSPERIDPRAAGRLTSASQRQRLLYGVTSCVAERGFAPTTIEAITNRAGVSKKTFYEQFPKKLACFLAAYEGGGEALVSTVAKAAAEAAASGADARARLRAALRAGLAFLFIEQLYARMFFIEILALGPEAVRDRTRCHDALIRTVRAWHDQARAQHPDWPAVPDGAYAAAIAATHELVTTLVATDRTQELPELEDTLMYVHQSLLHVPA